LSGAVGSNSIETGEKRVEYFHSGSAWFEVKISCIKIHIKYCYYPLAEKKTFLIYEY